MKKSMKNIKIVGINGRFTHSCLALFYVRNELEKHSDQVCCELYQFTINDNYYEMLLRLTEESPDYIFFSAAIWNSTLIEKLVGDLRASLPSCHIVIGGPQASVMTQCGENDMVTLVIGEIESVGSNFYRDLEKLQMKGRYGGSFLAKRDGGYSYPYRKDDFEKHLKNRHIYYESSKGCPFSCSYCLSATEKGLYHKDLDLVFDELADILSYGPKVVRFIDRTFNDHPQRALAIWQFLQERGGDTLFHFEMAPDRFTEDMFDFLETLDYGKFQFELGVQSTNPDTLGAVNRRVDPLQAHAVIGRLAKLGTIHLHADLILGLPYETRDTFIKSFKDIFAMEAHYIQMGLLKILPDTPICHTTEEYGYVHCKQPPYSVLANNWLNHESMRELYWFSECVEKFMNNRYFVTLWQYLRSQRVDIFVFFEELFQICKGSDFFTRPATQELMVQKLLELDDNSIDKQILTDILRYDWLRCGFRFLPDVLAIAPDEKRHSDLKSLLYQKMPAELSGIYTPQNRNQFFRKSYFLRIPQKSLSSIGLDDKKNPSCLCFLQDKEPGLYNLNKVLVLHC